MSVITQSTKFLYQFLHATNQNAECNILNAIWLVACTICTRLVVELEIGTPNKPWGGPPNNSLWTLVYMLCTVCISHPYTSGCVRMHPVFTLCQYEFKCIWMHLSTDAPGLEMSTVHTETSHMYLETKCIEWTCVGHTRSTKYSRICHLSLKRRKYNAH